MNLASKREHEMDILKGIGIFLVVLGHVNCNDNPLTDWIYSFHMPMFFMISGLYLDESWNSAGSLGKFAGKKIRSLMYPYLTFSVLALLWQLVLYLILGGNYLRSFYEALVKSSEFFGYGALWFLPTLFVGELLYGLWRRFKLKWYLVFPVLIVAVLSARFIKSEDPFFSNAVMFNLYCVFLRGVVCFLFLLVGCCLRKLFHAVNEAERLRKAALLLFSALLFILNLTVYRRNGLVNLSMWNLNDQFIYYVCALSGGGSLIIFFHYLARPCPPIEYFGRNSLIILATHSPLHIWNFAVFLYKGLPGFPGGYPAALLGAVFVMILEIPIIVMINRFAPEFISPARAIPRRLKYIND